MEELSIKYKEYKELDKLKFDKGVFHTESEIYIYPNDSNKILKIYKRKDKPYLDKKYRIINNLFSFIAEEKIKELVIPCGIVKINDIFRGEILNKVDGINSSYYLNNKNVDINKKIDILKQIGNILKKIRNSNPKYNVAFSDVHSDNFMVSNDKVYGIDTTGMKICDIKGVVNNYIFQLSDYNISKYELDDFDIIKPSVETDIYCYIMMILKSISGLNDIYLYSVDRYRKYLDELENIGFDINLLNSFNSIYDDYTNNIDPLPYLDTLYDLSDEKLNACRKVFTN